MRALGVLLLLLAGLFVVGAGQGYDERPADAMILPLGGTGTDYADLVPGIRGGTLHLAAIEDPKTWNHHLSHETSTTLFTNLMFRGLVTLHPLTGEIIPDLAQSYEISADGCTITFHLRKGICWSDGMPFTAEDVLFTYHDILLNNNLVDVTADATSHWNGSFPRCTQVDDYTVEFALSYPFRPTLNSLAFAVLPKHTLAEFFPKYNPAASADAFWDAWTLRTPLEEIVGNGPWVISEYLPGHSVIMTRNPYYYAYDSQGTQLPYYDQVTWHITSNQDESAALFLQGSTDCYGPRSEEVDAFLSLANESGFSVLMSDQAGYGTSWVMLNQDYGWWFGRDEERMALYRDLRFRQALAHSANKDVIIDQVYGGRAVSQWSPVSVPSPFYAGREEYAGPITESSAVIHEYDPALSSQLLDELQVVDQDGDGWRDLPSGQRLDIVLETSDNTVRQASAEILVAGWREIGLHVVLRITEFNQLVDSMQSSDFEMILLGLTGGDEPNGGSNVYFSCGNLHSFRYTACDDPTSFDRLIDAYLNVGATTMDSDIAFTYYRDYQIEVAEHLDLIYLVGPLFQYAYYDHVGNAQEASPVGVPSGSNGLFTEFVFDKRLAE